MLNAGIMTVEEFEDIINKKAVCACDFSASWCGPCRMMMPILEDVSEKYKRQCFFYQVDIDSAEDLAEKYNVDVVPTVIVFKNGKEVARIIGYHEIDEFEELLNNAIKTES